MNRVILLLFICVAVAKTVSASETNIVYLLLDPKEYIGADDLPVNANITIERP